MDDVEFDRLRKAICRSFNSQPYKKKYWLAVLDMQRTPGGMDTAGRAPSKGIKDTGNTSEPRHSSPKTDSLHPKR